MVSDIRVELAIAPGTRISFPLDRYRGPSNLNLDSRCQRSLEASRPGSPGPGMTRAKCHGHDASDLRPECRKGRAGVRPARTGRPRLWRLGPGAGLRWLDSRYWGPPGLEPRPAASQPWQWTESQLARLCARLSHSG